MTQVIALETILFMAAILSSYLTWGPFSSREMIEYFRPYAPPDTTVRVVDDALIKEWGRISFLSEVVRAAALAILSAVGLVFFVTSTSLSTVLQNRYFQIIFILIIFSELVYCGYLGPRIFARRDGSDFKFFSRSVFLKYTRPYWAWVVYPIAVWGGIGLIAFFVLFLNIRIDLATLRAWDESIKAVDVSTISDLQYATVRLISFGSWISTAAQKYVIATLLTFIYVIFEQRSTLQTTILDSSIERMKVGAWAAVFFLILFALTVLPSRYGELHSGLVADLNTLTVSQLTEGELSTLVETQQHLELHNLRWLLIQTLTGFGNLLALGVAGIALLGWRTLFREVPLAVLVRLFVPEFVIRYATRIGKNLRLDFNLSAKGGAEG